MNLKAVLKRTTGFGTASVEKSEFLSELLPYQNPSSPKCKTENVTRESEIVALAGEKSAVTIATNMAGRGTDIILGGNPIFKVKQNFQTSWQKKVLKTKIKAMFL
jgi:preprotein translocase subunit SecA